MDTERWRRLLLTEQARLETLRGEFDGEGLRSEDEQESLGELSAIDQHPADEGTETFNRERDVSLRDQVEGELIAVRRALARLEHSTYGTCEACGKPIAEERLEAEPATRYCIVDEAAAEAELRATRGS